MAGSRIRSIVSRQWELVVALGSRRRGMTIQQLIEELGSSRSTIYRDLRDLSAIGVPITAERINGEVRHSLLGQPYPPLVPTPMQVAALHLARRMMDGLAGTRLVQELDILLHRYAPARATPCQHAIELERQSVYLRSRNRVFAAHRRVAPQLLVPNQRHRRALRCLQLLDFARSGKPIGALGDTALPPRPDRVQRIDAARARYLSQGS